jgi:ABC-type Zn uptake system ZnuABC Zn-binding protein ZnuA
VHPKILLVPALLAAAALTLAGCTATAPGGAMAKLKVVATTTQVADFTRNAVGDTAGVTLTQLIQPNQSAHSFDPSAAALTALGRADVLVVNGVGLEAWLSDAIAASGFHGTTISADTGITVLKAGIGADTSAAGNPHIWTDVRNAEAMVKTIATGLGGADPADAAAFEANSAAYTGKLAELDGWIRSNVNAVPAGQRLLVSNHDALGYFTAAYDITYVGSVIPSFDDNAEPSAAEIDALVAKIKATGVKAVFSEASLSPKTAKTIASEAGVTVYSGADALYVDSLGPAGSAGATYIAAQLHNVTLILESWGATPSAIPADLQ